MFETYPFLYKGECSMGYPTNENEALDTICWSADVDTEEELNAILDTIPQLRIIKIDRLGVALMGHEVIDRTRARGLAVFDDAKLIEIPTKLQKLAEVEVAHRPWMLNCMAGSLSNEDWKNPNPAKLDGLKRFTYVCAEAGVKSCAVTVLTSKAEETVLREFGRSSNDQVRFYTEALIAAGFTDMVCSPLEAQTIQEEFGADAPDRNCPGVEMPGGDSSDQARKATPSDALCNGAMRLVIGRALTGPNAAANLKAIVDHILAGAPQVN